LLQEQSLFLQWAFNDPKKQEETLEDDPVKIAADIAAMRANK